MVEFDLVTVQGYEHLDSISLAHPQAFCLR